MAVRACRTNKGHRMPVRRGHGTVIAGPRGIVYTPPTREDRIRSMLEKLWRFMNNEQDNTHPLVRMAAGHPSSSRYTRSLTATAALTRGTLSAAGAGTIWG